MTAAHALRPVLPGDAPALADLFRRSVEELAEEDYSDAQRAAWASAAEEEGFAERLAAGLTLVVERDGRPVGFATLRNNAEIDLLYVAPEAAREGVATALVDALERLAAARGAAVLGVEASDTAEPLFRARGYEAKHRGTVPRDGEWLARTRMEKRLGGAAAAPAPSPTVLPFDPRRRRS